MVFRLTNGLPVPLSTGVLQQMSPGRVWSADLLSAVSLVDLLTNEGVERKRLNTQAVNGDSCAHTLPITLKLHTSLQQLTYISNMSSNNRIIVCRHLLQAESALRWSPLWLSDTYCCRVSLLCVWKVQKWPKVWTKCSCLSSLSSNSYVCLLEKYVCYWDAVASSCLHHLHPKLLQCRRFSWKVKRSFLLKRWKCPLKAFIIIYHNFILLYNWTYRVLQLPPPLSPPHQALGVCQTEGNIITIKNFEHCHSFYGFSTSPCELWFFCGTHSGLASYLEQQVDYR